MKKWIHAVALFALAHPALAAEWKLAGSNTTASVALPPNTYWSMPTSNSDDLNVVDVTACDNVDFGLSSDANGDGAAAGSFTATPQWCPTDRSDSVVNTNGERDNACVTFASSTLTGSGTDQGIGFPSGYFRVQVGGTHANDPIVWFHCNGPRN